MAAAGHATPITTGTGVRWELRLIVSTVDAAAWLPHAKLRDIGNAGW
ncbi:hypothetical protein [Chloroflexus sp.]|nr:hypothetical protein [Chloroflexus sp.]